MPYGTLQADKVADSYSASLAPISVPFRNRIINGAMVIDQRNAGASYTPSSVNNDNYVIDRFSIYITQASKLTTQQNAGAVTPPTGFTNYLGITSSSAYSVLSTDWFTLRQAIEGFNVADLGWGTASAQTITLSFQVRSSLTGTFGGSLRNGAGTRSYPFTYSIPVANTWTPISITIAGDTTGTWLTNNGNGISVFWGLGVGSSNSGTAGSWQAAGYGSATGATSIIGTNGATFYITGVQLEKGSNATSFDYRPYGTELSLCQRYFETYNSGGVAYGSFPGSVGYNDPSNNVSYNVIPFTVLKRATPTITSSAANTFYCDSGGHVGSVINFDRILPSCFRVVLTVVGNFPSNYSTTILASNSTAVATLNASAEL